MIKESSNLIKRETKLATSSSQNNKEHRYGGTKRHVNRLNF